MVAVIAAPILVLLIVQVATFPLTLHTEMINGVSAQTMSVMCNIHIYVQGDYSITEMYVECSGKHDIIFLSIAYAEYVILALFSIVLAYETKKYIGSYHNYLESAVINLTTILAVLLSSVCQVVVIILHINQTQEGELLVITLRDCFWMFPMIYLLFIPKVHTLLHSYKYSTIYVYQGCSLLCVFVQFTCITMCWENDPWDFS